MKFSLLFTAIVATLSSTAAAAAVAPVREPTPPPLVRYFLLKVPDSGPAPIAGKYLTPSVGGGSLGIFAGQAAFRGMMQGPARKGIIYSSRDKVFLSPTHGTPQYYARLGNPADDPTPALVLYKEFAVSPSNEPGRPRYWLDYDPASKTEGAPPKKWVACGGKDGYTVSFSRTTAPGCTAPFPVEVIYTNSRA